MRLSTRDEILDVAEKIIAQKGAHRTSVAEIAKDAGMAESQIYNYFKGKEDLLFSISSRTMKQVLKNLSEHLQGILDPMNRLAKMIWLDLRFTDTAGGSARLILFESRSKTSFYQHEAYALIQEYARIMTGILKDGIREGVFREDFNVPIARDIILGVLDWENLSGLASHEKRETVHDFEDIISFVFPMIARSDRSEHTEMDKSLRILQAAESVFAQKSYEQMTIREIASLAEVSEGTIYEYFKNKEALLLSITQQRFKEHLSDLREMFEIKTPLRKFEHLIRYIFLLYLREINFFYVLLVHIYFRQIFYESSIFNLFEQYTEILREIFEEGAKEGSIRPNIDARVFRNFLMGCITQMGLRWFILGKGKDTDKIREIDEVVELLSRAVAAGK